MKLLVLDGNSLVNRAYFGIKLLTTKDGRYTNAIFGFQNILLNLLSAHHPDAVAIAWDEKAPTFRHTAYAGSKATGPGMPGDLAQQMPVLKELLTDLGFVQVSKPGWEADDILGTLAATNEAAGGTTLLATGDRDSLQLVDDATTVLLATNRETLPMDPAAIQEKYGVAPPQLIEVKSLMGDASDNIPGVPGIGEKTALALISKFGSLQGVYDNIDDKAVKPGQRAKLTANRDKADLSYMLGTIRKDAPIETDPAAYLRQPGDPAAAAQLLAALEMHKLVDRWGLNGGTAPAPSENAAPLETVEPSPLPLLLEGRFYAARNADGNWYLVQGQDVYLPDTDRLAGFVGRLNHQKNPLFLMEVFASMAAQDPRWRLLLVGTGALSGIISNSGLKDVIISFIETLGLPGFMLAPISGMLMGAATASATAGTTLASQIFGPTVVASGVTPLAAAAMTHASCFVFDGLPHGSFFHVSAGGVNMEISERLKLLGYEAINGLAMMAASTLVFDVLKLAD